MPALRIILVSPPPGVWFALQEGRGSAGRSVDVKEASSGELSFDLTVGSGPKGFTGPYVQKDGNGQFVYLRIGKLAGQKDSCWERRAKIYLDPTLQDGRYFVRIPGTGRDGGPICATVKNAVWTHE